MHLKFHHNDVKFMFSFNRLHIMPTGAQHPGHHWLHDELCTSRELNDCHCCHGANRRPSPSNNERYDCELDRKY